MAPPASDPAPDEVASDVPVPASPTVVHVTAPPEPLPPPLVDSPPVESPVLDDSLVDAGRTRERALPKQALASTATIAEAGSSADHSNTLIDTTRTSPA